MVPGEFVFLHAPERHVGMGAIPVWTRVAGTVRTGAFTLPQSGCVYPQLRTWCVCTYVFNCICASVYV